MKRVLAAIPVVLFGFLLIVSPLLARIIPGENGFRFFLPIVAATVALLVAVNYRHIRLEVLRSPALLSLSVFMLFSAASVLWAINPSYATFRWTHQAILLLSVVLPFALVSRSFDLVAVLHLCCLTSMIINAGYVLTTPPSAIGHLGYFWHKQYLGMYASVTLMFALFELFCSWRRRALGIFSIILATWLLMESKSKLSFGFCLMAPVFAGVAVFIAHRFRWSPSLLLSIPVLGFAAALVLINNFPFRVSWWLTGDPTFNGRAYIWQVIDGHAALKPWFGWGFQSYWLVPNSPMLQEQSYVRDMLSGHNGYLDVRVQTGYVGLFLFSLFLVATFRQLDRVLKKDVIRTWLFASLGSFMVMVNYLDTTWLVSYDANWILFVIISAECARLSQPIRGSSIAPKGRTRLRRSGGARKRLVMRA